MSIKDQMAAGNNPYGDRLLQWEADKRTEQMRIDYLTAQNKLLAEAVVALDERLKGEFGSTLAQRENAPAIALATQITGENHE